MWKNYYVRPFYIQDFESRQMLGTFRASHGRVTEVIAIPQHGKMEAWYKTEEFGAWLIDIAKDVLEDGWTLDAHLVEFERVRTALLAASHAAANAGRRGADASELLQVYDAMMRVHDDFVLFMWLPWGITEYLEGWFVEQLKNVYPAEADAMYEVVARSPKPIQVQRMMERVWEWRLHGRDAKEMDAIVAEFGYLAGYSATHTPWTAEEIEQQAGDGDDAEQLRHARALRATAAEDMRALIARLQKEQPLLAKVATVINEYVWLRTERIDVYKQSIMDSRPWFRRVEELFTLPFGGAVHLSTEELRAMLQGGKKIDAAELQRRMTNGYVAHITDHGTRIVSDPVEQEIFITEHLGQTDWSGVREVRGQVACKGVIRGTARVLFHPHESARMQKGDILVTTMTHPDYMPAIRKAAAIVTDEGGVVCHAAVISRELKIPCVIGTQNGTKIFRDGETIEVDAMTGMVKKI